MRWMGLVLLSVVGMAGAQGTTVQTVQQMAKDAHPSLEVAAIRLGDQNSHTQGINADGHRLTLTGEHVKDLVMFAYGLHKSGVVGGPSWIDGDRYDIDGVVDTEGEPSLKQTQEIVQKLLVDRFGLRFHREQKEMGYFALTVAKGGPKLTRSTSDSDTPDSNGNGNKREQTMQFKNTSMGDLALNMQFFLHKPAKDETGLTGRYDFTLKWAADDMSSVEENAPPPMFTAIQEQLGLKLEAKRGPVEVLVLDAVSRPSGN